MVQVRKASVEDAAAMAVVHTAAWKAAYRGEMPDAYLDGLDATEATGRWRQALAQRGEGQATNLVLEDDAGTVVGIAGVGPERLVEVTSGPGPRPSDEDSSVGELWMINLHPASWGKGLGRRLLESATQELRAAGYREAVLWVLDTNERARRLYGRAGWAADGAETVDESRGFAIREVRYRRSL